MLKEWEIDNRWSPLKHHNGVSLAVRWVRLHATKARGLGLTPGQETRSHMSQLRICIPQQAVSLLKQRPEAAK